MGLIQLCTRVYSRFSFSLTSSHLIATAHRELPVKGSPQEVAQVDREMLIPLNALWCNLILDWPSYLITTFSAETVFYVYDGIFAEVYILNQGVFSHLFNVNRRDYGCSADPAQSWPTGWGSSASHRLIKCDIQSMWNRKPILIHCCKWLWINCTVNKSLTY